MIGCRFTKSGRDTIIYMIFDFDSQYARASLRPVTKEEIKHIQRRDARKKMDEIIKEYEKKKATT